MYFLYKYLILTQSLDKFRLPVNEDGLLGRSDQLVPGQVLHHRLLLLGRLPHLLQPLGHDQLELELPVVDDVTQQLEDLVGVFQLVAVELVTV